jgi:hypothetical protein
MTERWKALTNMWDKLQVLTYAGLLLVAVWFFGATFEPLRTRTFCRPVGLRLTIAMRVTAAMCAVLCLVALVWDIFFR